ncbi:type VI secretion system protein TssA [soil metagenome]
MFERLLHSISETFSEKIAPTRGASSPDPGAYIELLDPIDGGAGIELTHEDEYAALQDEIAKRGGIDDSVVLGNATLLLRERGKDLRAAVFMAYSTLRVDGLPSMLPVLGLIHALSVRFGDALHPRKPAARRAALEWLCNERFIDPLTLQAQRASEETLLDLQQRLHGLATCVQAWPLEAQPDLSGLTQRVDHWLAEKSRDGLRDAVSHGAVAEPTLPPLLGTQAGAEPSLNPKSSQDAWQVIRKASAVLRADPAFAEQGRALMRAGRWHALQFAPPHQSGVTRLPAPRAESRAYLEGLRSNAQWSQFLDEAARVFNEASNHLWLDLCCWSDNAYAQLGAPMNLPRQQLALDVRHLITRLPPLTTLAFDDGLAFANAQTQAWIAGLSRAAGESSPPASSNKHAGARNTAELLREAQAVQQHKGLAASLATLRQHTQEAGSQRERFEVQRLMLRLAVDDGHREIALGLARDLAMQIETYRLAQWQPESAFEVWSVLFQLLRAGRDTAKAEAPAVFGLLCGLDPARAATL